MKNIKEAIALVLETPEQDELVAARVPGANEGTDIPPHETADLLAAERREVMMARREDGLPLTIETVVVKITSTVSA